jgi:hypothetical protein
MPKLRKQDEISTQWDSQISLLAWLATCVSVLSFLFYFQRSEILLYGDAIAHINIARRVFDSKTPGLLQLGTVWLPLPHLLMTPFLVSMKMWRTGAGGSIPSMAGYVFSVVGIFRLTRSALSADATNDRAANLASWFAAVIYAANPNLIYMQSTAMGESVYLAFFIWAVAYFIDGVRGNAKALTKCSLCLAGASLTRYDGWFLAAGMTAVVVLDAFRSESWFQPSSLDGAVFGSSATQGERTALQRANRSERKAGSARRVQRIKFVLIAAAAPALWLAYNGIVYRNPLEFENGPYSAKAIEKKTQSAGNPGHPGSGSPTVSELYFLKAAQNNVAENQWLQRGWILLLFVAIVASLILWRQQITETFQPGPLLFLLIPVPFYGLSIAYGGVPIFIPQWWPFTHYNTRYGLQLLPAFSVAVAVLVYAIVRSNWGTRLRVVGAFALVALVVASYASIWHSDPITLREAQVNMRTRNQLERELAVWLEHLPANSTLLMYLGDHVGAAERAGFPLSRTINEGNHRVWKQPTDPEGLWERALANPSQYADYVLAFEGDPVWHAVHDLKLHEIVDIHVSGQARAVLYRAR